MGFNISGIAINRNYEREFEQLQKELGWNLEKQSEIDFETASSNWTEDGICNVYFTEKGTLMFIGMEMCTESFPLQNTNTLTFALSETSMAFNINYCENGVEKRSIMEVNDARMVDEGEKLEVEENSEDTSEIIWNQIEKVIGKKFWDIEPDEKAVRYVFVKEAETKDSIQESNDIDKIIPDDAFSKFSDDEIIQNFDGIIEFAQKHQINAFLYPWSHEGNSKKFMNLIGIVEEMVNRPTLSNEVNKRITMVQLKQLCRFNPDKVDSQTAELMMRELNKINKSRISQKPTENKKSNTMVKKWWEFWK